MEARDLGIVIGTGMPGPSNAITDVSGVLVGHTTLIEGEGPLVVGEGPVRTGLTVVLPHEEIGERPVFAGSHRLNGNGELTGLEWVRESGLLTTPIGLTNTHSVGVVRDALVAADVRRRSPGTVFWSLPVVGETWDGTLNDVNGMHVRPEHVDAALASASGGPVPQGNVGGGTGMICHRFKGGIGSASRVLPEELGGFTVGVLVQANYGRRERFRVDGVPVGEVLDGSAIPLPTEPPSPNLPPPGSGSIIVVVATDAPLLPNQCDRLAQRAGLGIGRVGGVGEHTSGDLFVAFATGNRLNLPAWNAPASAAAAAADVRMLHDPLMTPLFDATIEATEEAILNALLAAENMTGRDGITVHRLEPDLLVEVMERFGRGPRSRRPEVR
jgi:D-aminopeptidase